MQTKSTTPAASRVPSPRWRERIEIARTEISAALVVLADVLDRRQAGEPDWNRLMVASARLNELLALPR